MSKSETVKEAKSIGNELIQFLNYISKLVTPSATEYQQLQERARSLEERMTRILNG